MEKRKPLLLLMSLLSISHSYSQSFVQPNAGLKSHETLEIIKIELTSESTIVNLSLENRIDGGSFCADQNIYIIYPDGDKGRLAKANGIPVCPENYKFKSIGEKLDFNLNFPPLKPGTEWIDIIEECSANCFWFYGITLNNDLNKRLDEAFAKASKGKPEDNILLFRRILESIDDQDIGIEGSLYVNIINAAIDSGDKIEASVWYKRLLASHAPRLNQYIKFLNDRGIKY
jgi:hypothetical protein